ncbi:MAG TPA: hypothetical protein VFW71_11815 [Actinomycetota bacterium]|nr:hypothetical protein [Actinomycetota bacterium]
MSRVDPWHSVVDEHAVSEPARAIDPRYSALVVLLRHSALRWGEAVAVRRCWCSALAACTDVYEEVVESSAGPGSGCSATPAG